MWRPDNSADEKGRVKLLQDPRLGHERSTELTLRWACRIHLLVLHGMRVVHKLAMAYRGIAFSWERKHVLGKFLTMDVAQSLPLNQRVQVVVIECWMLDLGRLKARNDTPFYVPDPVSAIRDPARRQHTWELHLHLFKCLVLPHAAFPTSQHPLLILPG
jgi:hypothetical protein